MRRREFIVLIGTVAAWPLLAQAQEPGARRKLRTIGFVGANTAASQKAWTDAFVQRLGELGWREGNTVAIEYRWAEGRFDRAPGFMAELVRMNVDVIVTHATPNILAAKRATASIPIVFAVAGDPVASKLVDSLSHPGGNVTGLSMQQAELAAKRLEILRELVPGFRRLVILVNPDNPSDMLETRQVQEAANGLGVAAETIEIRTLDEIPARVAALRGWADALYVPQDPLFTGNPVRLTELARDARVPTVHSAREFVQAGGLITYGPDFADLFRRAGEYVDRILRGATPAELPVQQPTKFELAINMKTADALGIAVPSSLLARADEVIE